MTERLYLDCYCIFPDGNEDTQRYDISRAIRDIMYRFDGDIETEEIENKHGQIDFKIYGVARSDPERPKLNGEYLSFGYGI